MMLNILLLNTLVSDYVEKQYAELRNKASSYYRNRTKTERIERLLNSRFPLIRKGLYPAQFKYMLPGGNEGRSNFKFKFLQFSWIRRMRNKFVITGPQ